MGGRGVALLGGRGGVLLGLAGAFEGGLAHSTCVRTAFGIDIARRLGVGVGLGTSLGGEGRRAGHRAATIREDRCKMGGVLAARGAR